MTLAYFDADYHSKAKTKLQQTTHFLSRFGPTAFSF